ncbi:hypothetical protein [Azospirillum palustre]
MTSIDDQSLTLTPCDASISSPARRRPRSLWLQAAPSLAAGK